MKIMKIIRIPFFFLNLNLVDLKKLRISDIKISLRYQ